ncbi:MAG: RNA 3'-terminal phosphate cyclase [Methanothrix sp.]|nr:RNA 3'-terminal phosphate cyclase [Methanothrix sp.]
MIEIDGSYGEGGGQIVRTAVALSAVTGRPVRIRNIRRSRPRPGLAPQHAQAILALARVCSARTSGVAPLSTEVTFEPGEIRGGHYRVAIGTAGSITLLIQCLLPALLRADGPVSLEVQGGTDVLWSPTVDYLAHVFLPAIKRFGARAQLGLRQRGYYPRGEGCVVLRVEPGDLEPAHLEPQDSEVQGISHCSNLPEHVARRQADAASEALIKAGLRAEVGLEVLSLPSTGSGITLWSGLKGGSALGERGVPAERVGRRAAEELIGEIRYGAAVDIHLADQLIPYLALAGGSYTTREISMHTRTNIWTTRQFLDRRISVSGERMLRVVAV